MVNKFAPLPSASIPFVDKDGKPTPAFYQFILALSLSQNVGPLTVAANDAAAATAGVRVNGLYQTAGIVKIRLS
jgi:hypothetical protein